MKALGGSLWFMNNSGEGCLPWLFLLGFLPRIKPSSVHDNVHTNQPVTKRDQAPQEGDLNCL